MAKSAKKKQPLIPPGATVLGPQPGPQTAFLQTPADIAIYGGAAGAGKAIWIHTRIATTTYWKTMLTIDVGDRVFDENGIPCNVTHVFDVIENPESYAVRFDDGTVIYACADHQWLTYDENLLGSIKTTREVRATMHRPDGIGRHSIPYAKPPQADGLDYASHDVSIAPRLRRIVAVDPIDPIPMRCISVDSPSHLYLAGEHLVPTHNSAALLLEASRHIHSHSDFSAVLFRRTLADVKKPGSLRDASAMFFAPIGGRLNLVDLTWHFHTGSKVVFGHLKDENTVYDWMGAQIPLIMFDELTHFSKQMFFYMLSRNRSGTCKVKPYIRASCNPDADSWVAEFIAWWIDQETGFPIPERSGVLRYFVQFNDKFYWSDTREELAEQFPDFPAGQILSVTFIPGKLSDNPALVKNDPGYQVRLMSMNAVDRARLLDGNWKIRPAAGLLFQRSWCKLIELENIPLDGIVWVRGWDLAATPKTDGNDPDWTAGVKLGLLPNGLIVVADCYMFRESPGVVEQQVLNTADWDGPDVVVSIPQDPGQAGKGQKSTYSQLLQGYDIRSHTVTQKNAKVTRFGGFSAQAEHGNVLVVKGPWNEQWFTCLEGFPDAKHDDAVDATSEAFHRLVTMPRRRGIAMGTIRT